MSLTDKIKRGLLIDPPYGDIGSLTVSEAGIAFTGNQTSFVIALASISAVSYERRLLDSIVAWVSIDFHYGDVKQVALFADGGLIGWSGIIGGTSRIEKAVREHLKEAQSTPQGDLD